MKSSFTAILVMGLAVLTPLCSCFGANSAETADICHPAACCAQEENDSPDCPSEFQSMARTPVNDQLHRPLGERYSAVSTYWAESASVFCPIQSQAAQPANLMVTWKIAPPLFQVYCVYMT